MSGNDLRLLCFSAISPRHLAPGGVSVRAQGAAANSQNQLPLRSFAHEAKLTQNLNYLKFFCKYCPKNEPLQKRFGAITPFLGPGGYESDTICTINDKTIIFLGLGKIIIIIYVLLFE